MRSTVLQSVAAHTGVTDAPFWSDMLGIICGSLSGTFASTKIRKVDASGNLFP